MSPDTEGPQGKQQTPQSQQPVAPEGRLIAAGVNAETYAKLAQVLEPHHVEFRKIQEEINRLEEQKVIIKIAALAELSRMELNIPREVLVSVC